MVKRQSPIQSKKNRQKRKSKSRASRRRASYDRTSKSPKSIYKKFMSKYKSKSTSTLKNGPPPPHLNEDVVANIMSYLPTQDKIKSSAVSKTWNNAANLYDNKLTDVTYNQIKTPSFEKWINSHPKAKLNVMVKDFKDKNLFKVLYNYRNNIFNIRIEGKLKQLPECIGEFKQLRVLELDCLLTSLPDSIGQLPNLIKLDLQFNNLESLPESIGNLSNLQVLNLFNNSLTSLPNSIGNLTKLQRLILGFNQLTSLPESFGKLSSLKVLELTYNELKSLPESIGQLSNLQKLGLFNTKLTSLPQSIGKLPNLKEMNIGSNNINTELVKKFPNFKNITKLHY